MPTSFAFRKPAPRLRGSIGDLKRRAVRLGAAVIVDPRGGDIGVAEPFLHLGDVRLVVERIGGGGRAQGMSADLEPEPRRIGPHQPVNAIRGDRSFKPTPASNSKGCTPSSNDFGRLVQL